MFQTLNSEKDKFVFRKIPDSGVHLCLWGGARAGVCLRKTHKCKFDPRFLSMIIENSLWRIATISFKQT